MDSTHEKSGGGDGVTLGQVPGAGNKTAGNSSGELQVTPSSIDVQKQLEWYYVRCFPIELFSRWLRYGSDENLARREISFTLPGDIYIRWKSFESQQNLLEALKKSTPIKIDIGAIYNFKPSEKNIRPGPLIPVSKELVFDIDLTDYADVLGSMGGGNPMEECDRCWRIMATAVAVIDEALRQDFGFRHILWVYSGRRGVHCWVADERARKLTNEQRSSVAEFLHIRFEDRENVGKRQSEVTVPMHPSLARARQLCDRAFREFSLAEAGVLSSDESIAHTLGYIPSRAAAAEIGEKLRRMPTASGNAKWERVEKELQRLGRNDWALKGSSDYLVLRHVYPRLDVNVSKEVNHLLKAPFSVHPKTRRVCVPFRAADVLSFQPANDAPDFIALNRELDRKGAVSEKMDQAVEIFREFVEGVEAEAMLANRAAKLNEIDRNAVLELMAH